MKIILKSSEFKAEIDDYERLVRELMTMGLTRDEAELEIEDNYDELVASGWDI
jgi:hypothetical protein